MADRPDQAVASPRTVCPGRHRMETADGTEPFHVVWWDPLALNLGTEPPFGLRRQELIAKDVEPEVVAEGQRRYKAWRDGRAAAIRAGSIASCHVRTVTEWAAAWEQDLVDQARPLADVEVVEVEVDRARPAGPRYGALVHAALAAAPLSANETMIRTIVETHGRILGATPEEQHSAADVITRLLRHDLLTAARRADQAGRCFRETPITLLRGDLLLEGAIDLAFDDEVNGLTIVDFKTDRAEGESLDRYQRQVAIYAEALARAMEKPARAVILKI